MRDTAPVTVLFVTKDRWGPLDASLRGLRRLQPQPRQVLVVDNGSRDGTVERLAAEHPSVEVLAQPDNLGVARSRSLGISKARHEIVVSIDDDALIATPDALARVVDLFRDEHPDLALVAFRILNAALGVTLGHEFPRRRSSPRHVVRRQQVAYFIGCGFAVRRSVFLELGGFQPLIHYGLEELDLSYRLLEAGRRLLYEPAIVVRHFADPAARRGATWHYQLMRSRILVALRNLPLWAAVPHLAIWHAGMLGYGALRGHAGAVCKGAAAGWALAPQVWRHRRPISLRTAGRILRLSGRLFS